MMSHPSRNGRFLVCLAVALCFATTAEAGWRSARRGAHVRWIHAQEAPAQEASYGKPSDEPLVKPSRGPVQAQFPIETPVPSEVSDRPANPVSSPVATAPAPAPTPLPAAPAPSIPLAPVPEVEPTTVVPTRPIVSPTTTAAAPPRQPIRYGRSIITFDNKSGDPALVRLVGPTRGEVEVRNGSRGSIYRVAPGRYVIHVRYGTPGNYRYGTGDPFEVRGSGNSYSRVTITLHTVMNGNYAIRGLTPAGFAAARP